MKKQSFTGPALAAKSGVKPSFIYDVLSGKSMNPSSIKLARVAEALGVSLSYLVGEHDAFEEPAVIMVPGERLSRKKMPSPGSHLVIPFLEVHTKSGKTSSRKSSPPEDYHFSHEWIKSTLHAHPGDLRLFTLQDDAMAPTLQRGDVVLVDLEQKHPSPPGIFVLFDGFALVARRLKQASRNRPVQIKGDNPRHTAVEQPLDKIRILGRVVWMSRRLG